MERFASQRPRPRSGFTLIELLVVIAIIAILAAILFPVFAQAREKARQTVCLSRMKDFGMADNMYLQDYDETFPAYWSGGNGASWVWKLRPYLAKVVGKDNGSDRGGVFNLCPSWSAEARVGAARQTQLNAMLPTARQDFGINVMLVHFASPWFGPKNLAALTRGAANVPLFLETYDDIQPTKYEAIRYNHSDGTIITYADGHAKWMKLGAIPLTGNMATTNNPFYGYE